MNLIRLAFLAAALAFSPVISTVRADSALPAPAEEPLAAQDDLDAARLNGAMSAFLDSQTIIKGSLASRATYFAIGLTLQNAASVSDIDASLTRPLSPVTAAYFEGRAAIFRGLANLYLSLP